MPTRRRSNRPERKFGLLDTVAIGTGSIVAVGVFIVGAMAINYAGESVLASILIAAVLAILSGVCLTQLSSLASNDGGMYEYTRAYNPLLGFVAGLLGISALVAFAAAVAIRTVTYLNVLFFSGMTLLESTSLAIAFMIIGAILVISHLKFSMKSLLSLIALSVFAVLVALFFASGKMDLYSLNLSLGMSNYVDVLFAAGLIYLGLSGFNLIPRSRSQIADPDKTIKKATLLSIILLSILYIVFATVMISLLSQVAVGNVGPLLEKGYLGSVWLIGMMSAVRVAALLGIISLCFLISSKMMQSMSEKKDLLYSLKRVNSNGRPADAIVLCLFISIMLGLTVSSGLLVYFAAAAMVLAFILVEIAALGTSMKKRRNPKVKASLMGSGLFFLIPVIGIIGNAAVFLCIGLAPVLAVLIITTLSVLHFMFIRDRLPRKSLARNPVAVTGSGSDFIK